MLLRLLFLLRGCTAQDLSLPKAPHISTSVLPQSNQDEKKRTRRQFNMESTSRKRAVRPRIWNTQDIASKASEHFANASVGGNVHWKVHPSSVSETWSKQTVA